MSILSRKVILHIDDAKDTRFIVRKILETDGAEYFEAENVEAGIALALAKSPHAILLDLNMPGMNGFDFLERRKSHSSIANIPVAVLSGENDLNTVRQAIAAGAQDYILKNIINTVLLQKMRKLLRGQDALKFIFPTSSRPLTQVTLPAQIVSLNEAGLLAQTPVRLAGQTQIQVQSALLKTLGCGDYCLKTGEIGSYSEDGQFETNLEFVGIPTAEAKRLRVLLDRGIS